MKREILECTENDDKRLSGLADPVIAVLSLATFALTSAMRASAHPSLPPDARRRLFQPVRSTMPEALKLYHAPASPNSRRVRMFLAEKAVSVPLVSVDLGAGEQHSDAYRAINPRRVVPTLVLEDGTAIGEVLAIWRYLEEAYPATPLLGTTPKDKALVTMWERRAELEGFAAVMEGVRNAAPRLSGRAIAGPHDYAQIPELVERSKRRVANFYSDMDARLAEVPFIAGENFSAADITTLVTIDFATRALNMPIPAASGALKRWYDAVAARPAATA
jgi:glutathione S-transferase